MRLRTATLISGLAALAFVALMLAVIAHAGPLFRIDEAISEAAHRFTLAHPAYRSVLYAITVTGGAGVLYPVAVVAVLLLLLRRQWRSAIFIAVALPGVLTVRLILVNLIARPRPVDRLASAGGWSFPSGHSTAAAATAAIAIIICLPRLTRRWARTVFVVGAAGWAILVGWSRVGLVVHWPSDVLGAWLLVLAVVPAIAMLVRVPGTAGADPDPVAPGDQLDEGDHTDAAPRSTTNPGDQTTARSADHDVAGAVWPSRAAMRASRIA